MVYLIILWLLEVQVTKPRCFIQSIQLRIAKFKLKLKVLYNKFHHLQIYSRLYVYHITIEINYKICFVYKERNFVLFLQVFIASSSSNPSNPRVHETRRRES